MDDDLDIDAFIANMEQLAPKEEEEEGALKCKECNSILETDDEGYVCPNCSARPLNMMQMEDTELQYTEAGRAIAGQRVSLLSKTRKQAPIDYGWAWSTDDAIVHVLDLQIDRLEKLEIVPSDFRRAVANMYLKFWHENVAIYIKDQYTDEELKPILKNKTLKYRDIEVLVYSNDKIMAPSSTASKTIPARTLAGVKFRRTRHLSSCSSSSSTSSSDLFLNSNKDLNQEDEYEEALREHELELEEEKKEDSAKAGDDLKSWTLKRKTTSILTLNRTLAFLLASGYLLDLDDPLTAADLVRAVSQRLIPFFGAHKSLPEGMKLNRKDKNLFMKNKPPNPSQLTRAASFLVYRTYKDRLPLKTRSPNLGRFIERFIVDTNLPHDLIEYLDPDINFPSFRETKGAHFREAYQKGSFPLYERWAYSILLCNIKKLFILDDKSILEQKERAYNEPTVKLCDNFILYDWMIQISIRLRLIMTYDPYVLFHPMLKLEDLQPTPQVYNYVRSLIEETKVHTDIRLTTIEKYCNQENRSMLADFLKREFPKPKHLECKWPEEEELEQATDIKYPMRDAFERTKRFWLPEVGSDQQVLDTLFKDFSNDKIVLPRESSTSTQMWTICDGSARNMKFEMSPHWPYCFKLLLCLGGYLCFCEPKDLLREYRVVEEFVFPELYKRRCRGK